MTTTDHHYPPEPGAVQSLVAPHMYVRGSYRDMLSQDSRMAHELLRRAEDEMSDALVEWQCSTGPARDGNRGRARLAVERVKYRREVARAALSRLSGYRKEEA
jgi:hypothetical protein